MKTNLNAYYLCGTFAVLTMYDLWLCHVDYFAITQSAEPLCGTVHVYSLREQPFDYGGLEDFLCQIMFSLGKQCQLFI